MDHYSRHLQFDELVQRLRRAYPGGADVWQLAPVDQLHTGGIRASLHLCQRLARLAPTRVLDIGSGAGGLMRMVQTLPDCRVTGLDLSHGLNRLNQALAALHRATGHPALVTGDARALPFADATFDALVMQHSLLNIPQTDDVLEECHRILQPGGYLLLHELATGAAAGKMHYPVPWARDGADSHLHSESELTTRLQARGFRLLETRDLSAAALEWCRRQQAKETVGRARRAPASPAQILGPSFRTMADNLQRNLAQNAVRVLEILARRS